MIAYFPALVSWTAGSRGLVQIVVGLPEGLQIGDVVASKYRIERIVGSGAMGVVVAAHHLNLDRTVAIKFLVGEALHHPDAMDRFVREARAAARICSAHVVRVHDVAVLPSGVPFIELEYLHGCDLAARLRACVRLPVGLAVDFVLQACDAIAEAHDLRIIHRDLKPANLFVVPGFGEFETIKVLDFGIATATSSLRETMPPAHSQSGVKPMAYGPTGSPSYMSPEQMESARDLDERTDIWSLGVTLYEMLTGRLPFPGQSLIELYAAMRSQGRVPLRDLCPEVPEGLEAVIAHCLAFDRRYRFGRVDALARALLPFGSARAVSYVQRLAPSGAPVQNPWIAAASDGPGAAAALEPLTKTRISGAPGAPRKRLPVMVLLPLLAIGSAAIFVTSRVAKHEVGPPSAERTTGGAAAAAELPPGPFVESEPTAKVSVPAPGGEDGPAPSGNREPPVAASTAGTPNRRVPTANSFSGPRPAKASTLPAPSAALGGGRSDSPPPIVASATAQSGLDTEAQPTAPVTPPTASPAASAVASRPTSRNVEEILRRRE